MRARNLLATCIVTGAAVLSQAYTTRAGPADPSLVTADASHADHGDDDAATLDHVSSQGASIARQAPAFPPGGAAAAERLAASPRRGEWAVVRSGADSVRVWVVRPQREGPAPVVIAVHDNRGMSDWIRSVADQLAADGFIGVAVDLLSMKDVPRDAMGDSDPEAVRAQIGSLDREAIHRHISAVADWAMKLPNAIPKYGVVGFCWGGGTVFAHAVAAPALGASVVYYGTSPQPDLLSTVRAPVLGLYGGNDARVNATVPPAEEALKRMGRTFEAHYFEGAGHGFLRGQEGAEGANLEASRKAWPLTIGWFRTHLGT
ncbi:MAG: dienelactone hydrolase family protein [Gemmatimonadetes bacterium]|nr:dienelactone hydrolase family protein [Gemmatimonadota bacterium]